jgi:hypothetical protein
MWTSTCNDGQRLAWLEERVRHLERRLARYEPPAPPVQTNLLGGPGRSLSPAEIDRETERLLAVCAEKGSRPSCPKWLAAGSCWFPSPRLATGPG